MFDYGDAVLAFGKGMWLDCSEIEDLLPMYDNGTMVVS